MSTILQSGTVTPGHVATWTISGVLQDGGTAAAPYINALGVYGSGGTPFTITNSSYPGSQSGSPATVGMGVTSTTAYTTVNNAGTYQVRINGVTSLSLTQAGTLAVNTITLQNPIPVASGGTGLTAPGAAGTVLTSTGTNTPLAWGQLPSVWSQSVRSFGAVGNGVTDDTAAIQAALNAGVGYFPVGTYLVTYSLYIPSGVEVWGEGTGSVVVMGNTWGALPPSGQANSAYDLFVNLDSSFSNQVSAVATGTDKNITIRDITLHGNTTTTWGTNGGLIKMFGVTNFIARNLRLRYCALGIGIAGCSGFIVDNITHDDCYGFVTSIWWASSRGVLSNLVGTSNGFGTGGGCIQVNAQPNGEVPGSACVTEDIDITNVTWYGAAADGSSIQIFPLSDADGNIVRNVKVRGVTHNQTVPSNTASAVTITGSCQDIIITDIAVKGCNGTVHAVNINYEGTTSYYPNNVIINNLQCDSCTFLYNSIVSVLYGSNIIISNISEINSSYQFAVSTAETSVNVIVNNINCHAASTARFSLGTKTLAIENDFFSSTTKINSVLSAPVMQQNSTPSINLAGSNYATAASISVPRTLITGGTGGIALPAIGSGPSYTVQCPIGSEWFVYNRSGSTCTVYTASGVTLFGAGTITTNSFARFIPFSSTLWVQG